MPLWLGWLGRGAGAATAADAAAGGDPTGSTTPEEGRRACGPGKTRCGNVCIPANQCCNQIERTCPDGSCVLDSPKGKCCPKEARCGENNVCVLPCKPPKVLHPGKRVCVCPRGQEECNGKCVTPNCAANQVFDPNTCKCRCKANLRKCRDGRCVDDDACCRDERFCNADDSCLPKNECCRNEKPCIGKCVPKGSSAPCCPSGFSPCPHFDDPNRCCGLGLRCCNGICCSKEGALGATKCCGDKLSCSWAVHACPTA